MTISAKVICDSISYRGKRLTTLVVRMPKFILAEFNTHRMFSRNASSSRAIPVEKLLQQVAEDPVIPVSWGRNRPGMSASEELSPEEIVQAKREWLEARDNALASARSLGALGLHKQHANRLVDLWTWANVIVTATEWENFYAQRCHPDAQPEMKALAEAMLEAQNASEPTPVDLHEWHLPFVTEEEIHHLGHDQAIMCSVARCARVSYNNHDGTAPDVAKDIELYNRLRQSGHMSPFEHQATPTLVATKQVGNFIGWLQYRKTLAGENKRSSRLTEKNTYTRYKSPKGGL